MIWHYRAENQVQDGLRREGGPESKRGDADLNIIPSLFNKQDFLTTEEAALWERVPSIGRRMTQRLHKHLSGTLETGFLHQKRLFRVGIPQ